MRSIFFTTLFFILGILPAASLAEEQSADGEIRRELDLKGRTCACVVLKDKSLPGDLPERKFRKYAETQAGLLTDLSGLPGGSYAVRYRYRFSPVLVLEVRTRDVLDKLASLPDVARVHPDLAGQGALVQSRHMVRADGTADLGFRGNGRTVAVLDSGVVTSHPDIEDAIIHQYHFLDEGSDIGAGAEDGHSHGSNVTGIIASRGRVTPSGVAPEVLLVAVKVLDDSNSGFVSDWAAGVEHVISLHEAKDGIRVDAINMSLATRALFAGVCDDSFTPFSAACRRAQELGIAVFGASGNNGRTAEMSIPGCYSSVYSVGSVFDTLPHRISSFTNRNQFLDLLAPGECITSMGFDGGTSTFQGTSQATPHATAIACLLREIAPEITPAGILEVLKSTGIPVEDPLTGLTFPRVDALAAAVSLAAGDDCNQNGVPDLREIFASGASLDCNGNRVPDECDLEAGASLDCNQNGIPDECELTPSFALGTASEFATGDGPTALVAADLDGDAALDLATTNTFSDTVSVLHNSGGARFTAPRGYPVGDRPGPLAAGDLDGDGKADLVAGNAGSLTIPGRTVTILYQRPAGAFEVAEIPAGSGPSSLALGDMDGDGNLDMVVGHGASRDVLVLLNAGGTGAFTAGATIRLAGEVVALALAELGGAEGPDIAVLVEEFDRVFLFLNDGGGDFTAGDELAAGGVPSAVIAGDLDGDGDSDLATANFEGNDLSVLLQEEGGRFTPAASYFVGGGPGSLAAADLEGDMDLDLATANRTCRDVSVFLNSGDGRYRYGETFRVGSSPRFVAAGDLDGQGGPELVAANLNSDTLSVLPNRSRPGSSPDCNRNGKPDACDIEAGVSLDRDQNGIPDECGGPKATPFHRGDADADGIATIGDGVFVFNFLFLGGRAPTCKETIDTNNDGALDISDGIGILNFLFLGGRPPEPPGPPGLPCGPDRDAAGSPGDLGCELYDPC